MSEPRPQRTQLSRSAQGAVDKEAVDDGVETEGQFDKSLDELIRDGAAKAIAPAFEIKPQKVLAVFARLTDPELSNRTAIDKNIVHSGSPDVVTPLDPPKPLPLAQERPPANRWLYCDAPSI
jgi:hypothetical protein